jgi:magnesium chelatase subunit D
VTDDDVRRAAFFALPHRLREAIAIEEAQPETEQSEQQKSEEADKPEIELAPPDGEATEPFAPDLPPNDAACAAADDDRWQDIEPVACPPKVQLVPAGQTHPQGAGKRLKTQSHTKKGRYARYRMPNGKTSDIALDATIRAAVMHPSPPGGLAVQVRQEDVREKVREHRTGASILFLVDASGSMGARRRMGAVKGAVVSMLKDAYQKRDTVGIVSFRKDRADCVLGLTRSVDLAEKKLRDLKTGGKTPLALGLMKAYALLKTERIKNPDALQYLVVVSDGRANISPNGGDAFEEALQIAKRLRTEHVQSLLLDTENGYIRLGFGKKLADALGGEYLLLQTITGGEIKASVSDFLKR